MAKNYNAMVLSVLKELDRAVEYEPGKEEYVVNLPKEIENSYQAKELLRILSADRNVSLRDMSEPGQGRHGQMLVFYRPTEIREKPSLTEKAEEVKMLIGRMNDALASLRSPSGLTADEWKLIDEVFKFLGVK